MVIVNGYEVVAESLDLSRLELISAWGVEVSGFGTGR